MRDWRVMALVAAVLMGGNAAFALGVPALLDATTPSMPHGYREVESPTTEAGATFVEVAEQAGIVFRRYAWTEGDLPYPAVVGGGVAAGDVDRDGWVDLYFTPGGPGLPAKLYRNLGDWRFEDITERAGLARDGWGFGAAFGDYDNDGHSDLYVLIDGEGMLYRNLGHGRFEDVTARAGEASLEGLCGARPCQPSSAAWLDYDLDGDLDLYVVNNLDWRRPGLHTSGQDYASLIYFASQQYSVLLRNDGGVFTDVTDDAGVENTGKGLGVAVADLDGNGWPDLATANDISENAVYLNLGNGKFRNVARDTGANEVKTAMGIQAGDVDGDLDMDLVISNFRGHKLSLLLQDQGRWRYTTDDHGLGASWRGTGWGVALFDYDLDGWLDVAHAVGRAVPLAPHLYDLNNIVFQELVEDSEDQLFRNLGHGWFAEATYTAGAFAGRTTTRALLAVDLDNDGDEDVVRVNQQGEPAEVLRNDRHNEHHWIQVTFQGGDSNRDGFGAKVRAELPDGQVLVRERSSAAGYQTGLSPVMTLGLGRSSEAHVVVTWPSGTVQDLGMQQSGSRLHVVEDAS